MTFGRPPMTTHGSNVPLATGIDESENLPALSLESSEDNANKMLYLNSSVALSAILEKILCRIYKPWGNRTSRGDGLLENNYNTIIELDSQLLEFESSVPLPLSWMATRQPELSTTCRSSLIQMQRNVLHGR